MAIKDPILIRNAVPTTSTPSSRSTTSAQGGETGLLARIFAHYGSGEKKDRIFLVAEAGAKS